MEKNRLKSPDEQGLEMVEAAGVESTMRLSRCFVQRGKTAYKHYVLCVFRFWLSTHRNTSSHLTFVPSCPQFLRGGGRGVSWRPARGRADGFALGKILAKEPFWIVIVMPRTWSEEIHQKQRFLMAAGKDHQNAQ
jgi:hypothetical protein